MPAIVSPAPFSQDLSTKVYWWLITSQQHAILNLQADNSSRQGCEHQTRQLVQGQSSRGS
eukprot:1139889-Pelagomonas_calceolata.AAC.5